MNAATAPQHVPYVRMHGLGNTFVIVDDVAGRSALAPLVTAERAARMCDRTDGIGADGVILVQPPRDPTRCDLDVVVFNADGSDGGMCGNGLRCVARLAHDRGYTHAEAATL